MKCSFRQLVILIWLCGSLGIYATENFPVPRGIYAIDSGAGFITNGVSMRDANIRTNDFVTGYVLRAGWSVLETNQGQFDFTIIDWNVRKLAALNKKLSLEIINVDPPWLTQTPGVMTWLDADTGTNRAVPWDPFLLVRVEVFLNALAEHPIDGVKLKDHPVLEVINFGMAGAMLAIRDPSVKMRDMTNYSRANLTNAVLRSVRATVTNFPTKFVNIGLWPVTDYQSSPPLWEATRQAILAEFNGVIRPRIGFWMENLSASRTGPGVEPVTGRPNTNFGAPLFLSQTNAWVGFQALTSWFKPFNNFDGQVTNATPFDGMRYANDTYGTTYFELYVGDIDNVGYRADFQKWRARLFPPETIHVAQANPGTVKVQWTSWSGGEYQVEMSTNLSDWISSGIPLTATTNITFWTNTANLPVQFYRLRTLP